MTSDLFELIKSLSPTEKKFVEKYAFLYKRKGDNILLKLFRLIGGQNEYNEDDIKSHVKNLAHRKIELWEKIMSVLQYRTTSIQMVNARRSLDFIHILASKQLFNQALRLIEEMKKWSTEHGQLYYAGITLQYESGLAQYMYKDNHMARVPAICKQLTKNAEDILLTTQVFEFYTRSSLLDRAGQFPRNNIVREEAKALLHDPYYNLDISKMALRTLFMFMNSKSMIHYVNRDYDKCYEYEYIAKQAFLSKNQKTDADWGTYRAWLANIMQVHSNSKNFGYWKADLDEFERVMLSYFKDDLLTQCKFHRYRFWYHYRYNQFKDALSIITETEAFYKRSKRNLTKDDRVYYSQDFAIAFFDMGDINKAWEYCHEGIENGKENMPDIYEFVIMLFLFIILEKNDYNFLRSRLKLFSRYLVDKDITEYAFDHLVNAFMKRMLQSKGYRMKQKEHLQWLKEEIIKLLAEENVYTLEVIEMLDLIKWTDKKMKDHNY